ncbi:MAG: phage major capsid protein [Chitinophagaceae bacterium]|nr:phage major capsid protein [Chitinophagaceae bacterium]
MTQEQIAAEVKSIGDNLTQVLANSANAKTDAAEAKSVVAGLQAKLESVATAAELKEFKDAMQSQFDALTTKVKKGQPEGKSFSEALAEKLEGVNIEAEMRKNGRLHLELPEVKTITLASNLSGDSVATYNSRQAINPAQLVNFRDFVPTTQSPTGLYVTYREAAGNANNIAAQLEGSLKRENDYSLTEVKTVNQFIAGFSKFSRQMLASLPFMSQTLPRLLTRDFFRAENAAFFSTVSGAATGSTTTSASADLGKIIQLIGNLRAGDFSASVVFVSNEQWSLLLNESFTNGYYMGAGGLTIGQSGVLNIAGVPIVGCNWVPNNRAFLIDSNYLERVEVNGVNIELSYEDQNNFVTNMVTARIECYEAINLMLPNSAIFATI